MKRLGEGEASVGRVATGMRGEEEGAREREAREGEGNGKGKRDSAGERARAAGVGA